MLSHKSSILMTHKKNIEEVYSGAVASQKAIGQFIELDALSNALLLGFQYKCDMRFSSVFLDLVTV